MSIPPSNDELARPSLKRLGGAVYGLLQSHMELFCIELQEEKVRSIKLFVLIALSLFFSLLLVIGLSAALVIVLWQDHRIAAILGLCALYFVALIVTLYCIKSIAKPAKSPFEATLNELANTREELLP